MGHTPESLGAEIPQYERSEALPESDGDFCDHDCYRYNNECRQRPDAGEQTE